MIDYTTTQPLPLAISLDRASCADEFMLKGYIVLCGFGEIVWWWGWR